MCDEKGSIRTRVIKLLNEHEYLKLDELMHLCPGAPRGVLEGELKSVAEIEKNGKHMNAYKLLPLYKGRCEASRFIASVVSACLFDIHC